MSGGTLFSLGTLALVTMASKALLVAFGAIILIFFSSGWMPHFRHLQSGSASTVYEVIAKPQVSHSYLSEVHHEPYSLPPSSPPPSTKEYAYYGHRWKRWINSDWSDVARKSTWKIPEPQDARALNYNFFEIYIFLHNFICGFATRVRSKRDLYANGLTYRISAKSKIKNFFNYP